MLARPKATKREPKQSERENEPNGLGDRVSYTRRALQPVVSIDPKDQLLEGSDNPTNKPGSRRRQAAQPSHLKQTETESPIHDELYSPS
ncbi:hypothetical protein GJ744_000892 [Endocarpon pusillum]|uniref:Uncharacterized protein n=1 Tax=Endocarpon pusillum TaxID=364733 RepID=A0A8H7ATC1_9EURO|nr:hypothetical protein GJ744_000892 [Endocarpon pusillum]